MGREGDGESAFVTLERTLIGALQVVLLAGLSCVWLVALWGSLSLKLSFNARKQDTLSIGQPGALLRTENTLRSQLRDCSYTCSECITTLHFLIALVLLLYSFEVTLALALCGGGGGNLFERGVGAFISRANKRQLTNKPLIESPRRRPPPSFSLSLSLSLAADLVHRNDSRQREQFRCGRRWKSPLRCDGGGIGAF